MKKLIPVIGLALAAIAVTATTVAQGKTSSSNASAAVCVLLPDPKTSVRWETQDRPAFVTAFQKARVSYVINNANGDAQRQKTQADQCLAQRRQGRDSDLRSTRARRSRSRKPQRPPARR